MRQQRICRLSLIRHALLILLVTIATACGGGSDGDSDGSTDGSTTDGNGNTDGGTTDGGAGGNTDGGDNGNTDGGSTDGGNGSDTDGGGASGALTITAYDNRLSMTPLQDVLISIYGDDDRTIAQTQQTDANGSTTFASLSTIDGLISYTVFFEGEPGIDGSFITLIDSEPGDYVYFANDAPDCQPVATLNVTVDGATNGNFASLGPLIADGATGGGAAVIDNGIASFANATVCSEDLQSGNLVTLLPIESTGEDIVAYTIIDNVPASDATLTATFDMPASALNWAAADPANAPDVVSLSGVRDGLSGSIRYSLLGLANTSGSNAGSFSAVGTFPGDNIVTAVRGIDEEACSHQANYPSFPASATTDIPAYQLGSFSFDGSTRTFDITRSDTITADLQQITTFFARSTGFSGDEIQWNFFVPPGRTRFDIPAQPAAIAATFNDDAIDTDRTTVAISDLISSDGSLNLDGFNAINAAFGDGEQTNRLADADLRSCNFNLISFSNVGDDVSNQGDRDTGDGLTLSGSAASQLPSTTFSPATAGFLNAGTISWTSADGSQLFALTSGSSGASLLSYTPGAGALANQAFQAQVAFGSNVPGLTLSENMAMFASVTLTGDSGATLALDGDLPFTDTLQ